MKKIIFSTFISLLFLLLSFRSSAQVTKGQIVVGGTISYSNQKNSTKDTVFRNTNKEQFYNFSPQVGYAVKNNLVIGLNMGYSNSKSSYEHYLSNNLSNQNKIYNKSFSIGPFVRLYKPLNEKLLIFADVRSYWMVNKVKQMNDFDYYPDNNNNNYKSHGIYLYARPGITYFLTKKFALELLAPGIGGGKTILKKDSPTSSENSSVDFNINPFNFNFRDISLGGMFYF
jgi:outer membrane immunogenic protein